MRKKIVNINFDQEPLEALDRFVEKLKASGEETNRSKVARRLIKTALVIEESRS